MREEKCRIHGHYPSLQSINSTGLGSGGDIRQNLSLGHTYSLESWKASVSRTGPGHGTLVRKVGSHALFSHDLAETAPLLPLLLCIVGGCSKFNYVPFGES